MTAFKAPEPKSNLGERLLEGVRALWARVQSIESDNDRTRKVVDQQGIEIEQIKIELKRLQSEIRSVKISRGRTRAKNARLLEQIAEAKRLLPEIERRLN